jgi:hypothetical protein
MAGRQGSWRWVDGVDIIEEAGQDLLDDIVTSKPQLPRPATDPCGCTAGQERADARQPRPGIRWRREEF